MTDFEVRVKKFREERNATWAEFLSLSAEAGYTIEDSLANRALFMSGYESGKEAGRVREAFEKGRASVVFNPHSHYRDKLREMICEGDFDFTNIFEEIEYEGETYTDISNEGADALADYFIDLMEQIDERRSEDVVTVNICDTCEEPYQVNANFDRHDCGKAGASSVDRRAVVEKAFRRLEDYTDGVYGIPFESFEGFRRAMDAVLASMGGDDENSKM